MPDYNITTPDGQKYKVTAPNGATQEQVLSYAKEHHASQPAGRSSIDAALPTTPSTFTGDASTMKKLGADQPGYEYGNILPFKKETATGKVSLAMPEAVRAPLRGVGDLISQAQNKGTESTPDAIAAMTAMVPGAKPAATAADALGAKVVRTAAKPLSVARDAVNKVSDKAGKPNVTSADKANAHIVKTLLKAGHSPEEIVEMMQNAKDSAQTAGEASKNPALLGEERKISGMNREGGETMRAHAGERVDPKNPTSIPSKLRGAASALTKKMQGASAKIGDAVSEAPKYPVDMRTVRSALKAEKIVPGSSVSTTVKKIGDLSDWAKSQGDTFAAWHRVKQEIYNLKAEANNPTAVERLDANTVNAYYKKVNNILRGTEPGLPVGLQKTGEKYAAANDEYRQHKAGEMISDVLKKMPTGGTPSQTLSYLYKKLAGSPAAQEELFGHMPPGMHASMMKLFKAISESARGGINDVVKSGEEGTPTFPKSKQGAVAKMGDWLIDKIRRKDYDALAKAFTNPDVKEIARQLNVKPAAKTANQALGAQIDPLAARP